MKTSKKRHLSSYERELIALFHAKYYSIRQIAKKLGRSPSTISREFKRKEAVYHDGHYLGAQTHKKVKENWGKVHKRKKLLNPDVQEYILQAIKHKWSPETTAGRLMMKFGVKIHHQTIYRFIKEEKPEWEKYLTRKNFHRKAKKDKTYRSKILNRTDISQRPQSVAERIDYGHFEADTVLSTRRSNHSLVVVVERVTRQVHIKRLVGKKASDTSTKIISILKKYPKNLLKTITYDNGIEFAFHDVVNYELDMRSYFCDPYSAWQKGTVENINGLIRRFFPKGTDFDLISDAELQLVEDWINNRPMKVLNFKTPNEMFTELTGVAV